MRTSFQRLTRLIIVATMLGLSASAAAAQVAAPPPAPSSVVSGPRWDRRPDAVFPDAARTAGVESGAVTLMCGVTPQGIPKDCIVVQETPPGFGFADSALAAMRAVTMFPRTEDGREVSSTIRFTLRFSLTPPASVTPPSPTE